MQSAIVRFSVITGRIPISNVLLSNMFVIESHFAKQFPPVATIHVAAKPHAVGLVISF